MISEFINSWPLFHASYLSGWLIAVLLALIGVVVVARDQIFIGAAVSQASTLGIALAMWVAARAGALWVQSDVFLAVMAVLFSVIAALLTARGGETGRESREAITGWVFLLSASSSVLLVSHSPHGLEEIHRLGASSIIGASTADIWLLAAFCVATATLVVVCQRRILLITMDPPMAAAVGLKTGAWEAGIALWIGIAVGVSIKIAGLLYTFGCLVLPALVARNVCREVRSMFCVAPTVSVVTVAVAFVLAHHYDYPPGQMAVALLGAVLCVAWAVAAVWER